MSANVAAYAVLLLFALILIASAILIAAWKLRRQVNDRPVRARLAGLPSAVVLDPWPPPRPPGRERRVARDMVIEATAALAGPRRERAIRWPEDNGYVQESIGILRWHTNRRWRRAEAAFLLGQMGSPLAAPALTEGLRDPSCRIRDACAIGLGRVATINEVPALIEAVERRRVPQGILSVAAVATPTPWGSTAPGSTRPSSASGESDRTAHPSGPIWKPIPHEDGLPRVIEAGRQAGSTAAHARFEPACTAKAPEGCGEDFDRARDVPAPVTAEAVRLVGRGSPPPARRTPL